MLVTMTSRVSEACKMITADEPDESETVQGRRRRHKLHYSRSDPPGWCLFLVFL
jgi:hypothetical protein